MAKTTANIRFKAKLLRPESPKGAAWTFFGAAISRERKAADAEHDDRRRHARWPSLPDDAGTRWTRQSLAEGGQGAAEAASAVVGHTVAVEITPAAVEPEPRVPIDVRKALAAAPAAQAQWSSLTPVARRDWIHWITSGKKAETRERRIITAFDMLASGKRRACCFDRSGMYSKGLGAPTSVE